MRKVCVTSDEAVPTAKQHDRPCGDCPWRRDSLKGWLGGNTSEEWIGFAHSDTMIPCHTLDGPQCAGSAIYRANILKLPRDRRLLRLEADRDAVFDAPAQFLKHHKMGSR